MIVFISNKKQVYQGSDDKSFIESYLDSSRTEYYRIYNYLNSWKALASLKSIFLDALLTVDKNLTISFSPSKLPTLGTIYTERMGLICGGIYYQLSSRILRTIDCYAGGQNV
jgi:hypothetical protein